MKRIISFLLILALLICLVACGNDGESSSSESQAEQSSTETQSESTRESESVTESETQGNTSSESATESESQSQSTESVTESETNSESSETITESEQESEINSETESESTTESETESEIESESSTETESETESESESESESENQNPTTVAEWVEANSNEINAFMNTNYLTTFAKKAVSLGFNADKIQKVEWIFGGEENINSIKLMFTYKPRDTTESIRVVSYNFDEPINGEDFLKTAHSITASELKSDYSFAYNPTIQGTRDDLVNALFNAVGVNEVGGPRYFKDNGQTAGINGLGMANSFTVVEVGENQIREYKIYVNVASDDAGYIQKLLNPSEYVVSTLEEKVVDITGASVEYVAQ